MRVCLDSSFVIDILKKREGAYSKLRELEAINAELLISTLVVFECYVGCYHKQRPRQLAGFKQLLKSNTIQIIPVDEQIAEEAGKIQGELLQKGLPSKIIDLLIGVTAIQQGAIVLTRDTNHFENLPGLIVKTW